MSFLQDKILVLGPEGCGNHLIQNILRTHPAYKTTPFFWGSSLPHGRKDGDGVWYTPSSLSRARGLLYITRSLPDAVYSAYRRFGSQTSGRSTREKVERLSRYYMEALGFIHLMAGGFGSCVGVRYEVLVKIGGDALRGALRLLGVKPVQWEGWDTFLNTEFPGLPSTGVVGGREGRWRQDPEFTSAIQPYLGDVSHVQPV